MSHVFVARGRTLATEGTAICSGLGTRGPLAVSRLDRIVQQQPVAAAHHFQPIVDETANLIFARVAFPILFRSSESEQDFGDGAIALAALVRIERP